MTALQRMAVVGLVACASGCTSAESMPPAPVAPAPRPQAVQPEALHAEPAEGSASPVLGLAQVVWPTFDVRLAAVDDGSRRAIVWMQRDGHVSVAAFDFDSGQELERWDTTPTRMPSAGRFETMGDDLAVDVARYAAFVGADEGRYITPGFVVAPGGKHVLYGVGLGDGRDGDAWQVADRDGRALFRFAPSLVASTEMAFSPDGLRVAWGGCCHALTPGANPYHLYLGDLDGPARRVVELPYPGVPIFDGNETVYVASRPDTDRICVHRVPFSAPKSQQKLLCRASADRAPHLFFTGSGGPDDRRLVVVNPRTPSGDYELLVVGPKDGAIEMQVETRGTTLDPLQVDESRFLLTGGEHGGLTLADLGTGELSSVDEYSLGGFLSYPRIAGRRDAAPFALAVRGQRGSQTEHELVRITLP